MALARADLESLLRTRRLDRTLTSTIPAPGPTDDYAVAPIEVAALDARLGGGLPRGQLSELVGARSSGRMSLLGQVLASATRRGELVAVVDALDMLDIASLDAAGVALDRLLWIRGHVVMNPGMCRDLNQRALEQALRALSLVLQAGHFGVVALDVAEAPAEALRRLPFTTWLRLQRMVEGSSTVALLVGDAPMARSSAGLTIQLARGLNVSTDTRGLNVSTDTRGLNVSTDTRGLNALAVNDAARAVIHTRIVRSVCQRGHEDAHVPVPSSVSVHV